MSLISLPVFALTALAVLLFWLGPPRLRAPLLVAVGLAFAGTQATLFVVLYLGLAGIIWLAGARLYAARQAERPVRAGFIAALVVLLGNLMVWKIFEIQAPSGLGIADLAAGRAAIPGYAEVFVPAGLSFLTFRLIHFLAERARGSIEAPTFSSFLAWLFFFPLFLAGPLMRYPAFARGLSEGTSPGVAGLNRALLRIASGLVKKLLIADQLGLIAQPVLMNPEAHSPLVLIAALYGASFQLYMDFSGYSDMAIGLGLLFGLKVPENFDWPILQTNIAAFWRKWHITLYTFFRDYVFLPLFGFRASPARLYIGIGVTIFLFQVWHRLSWSFVLLGLFHGFGVIVTQVIQQASRKRRWLHRGLKAIPAPLAIWATFTWFSLGNVLFMTDPLRALGVLRGLLP